jgi:hypothetical protein
MNALTLLDSLLCYGTFRYAWMVLFSNKCKLYNHSFASYLHIYWCVMVLVGTS